MLVQFYATENGKGSPAIAQAYGIAIPRKGEVVFIKSISYEVGLVAYNHLDANVVYVILEKTENDETIRRFG